MKRIIIIGSLLVLLIVGGSYLATHPLSFNANEDTSNQSVEFSENGITLLMPGNWVSADSSSNTSVLAIADPNSKDSSGFNDINVNIEKKSNAGYLESEFKSNYNTLARNSDFDILFEGNVTFNGESALEADYLSTVNGTAKQHKAVWVQKDSDIYVILCSAPQDKFDEELSKFDFIINNVQL